MRNQWPTEDKPSSVLWYGCFFSLVVITITTVFGLAGFIGDDVSVVHETYGLRSAKEKYEWFKSAADNINAKRDNINAQKAKIASIYKSYEGEKRRNWDRVDKENIAVWETELAGMISNHNNLVAEYNAAAKKITWNFARSNELPQSFETLKSQ